MSTIRQNIHIFSIVALINIIAIMKFSMISQSYITTFIASI